MVLSRYRQLNEQAQLDTARFLGAEVGTRREGPCTVRLYQVSSFYVEVFHHNHFNVVVRVRSFSGTAALAPYLRRIDISELGF